MDCSYDLIILTLPPLSQETAPNNTPPPRKFMNIIIECKVMARSNIKYYTHKNNFTNLFLKSKILFLKFKKIISKLFSYKIKKLPCIFYGSRA